MEMRERVCVLVRDESAECVWIYVSMGSLVAFNCTSWFHNNHDWQKKYLRSLNKEFNIFKLMFFSSGKLQSEQ